MSRKIPDVITIDFETKAIQGRPAYPPVPVGVSIQWPGERKPVYHSWGHPTGNNCTYTHACEKIQACFESGIPMLYHNAKFDVDVAVTHMDCPMPAWDKVHDTLFLLFLHDPYAATMSLKPAAERILGLKPTEQDAVRNWLVANNVVKPKDRRWGAYIADAPGDLVGKYAKGDVTRTLKLFRKLYPLIVQRGMLEAYNRERALMPILLANETDGVRVDLKALKTDVAKYTGALEQVEGWLKAKLKAEVDFNSAVEVASALHQAQIVTDWALTKTGKRSTAKKNLTKERFTDPQVWLALSYRSKLAKCLSTYMDPWLKTATKSKGKIYVGWNQVRQSWSGGGGADAVFGARTGRPSTSPNLLAVTKSFYDRGDGYEHPEFVKDLPELPTIRNYILPDKGHVMVHLDYNQQELRVLAHFEDAGLCGAFRDDPMLDVHTYVQERIREATGILHPRRHIKTLNFGMLYGMGVARLAETLKITPEEAKELKTMQKRAIPGLSDLEWNLKRRAADDDYIRTWGGREYYCEPPRIVVDEDGFERERTFEYKLLNYLIQGSAADITKQALINYDRLKQHGRFIITVYDEINISVPREHAKAEMALLKQAMESVELDVAMMTDSKMGSSWGKLKGVKK